MTPLNVHGINMAGEISQLISPALQQFMTILGMTLVALGIMKWVIDLQRGHGNGGAYTVLLGILMMPQIILKVIDLMINATLSVVTGEHVSAPSYGVGGSTTTSAPTTAAPTMTPTPTPTVEVQHKIDVQPIHLNTTLIVMIVLAGVALVALLLVRGPVAASLKNNAERRRAAAEAEKQFREKEARKRAENVSKWSSYVNTYKEIDNRFLEYDRDLELLLKYPLMRDYRQPETIAMIHAMDACRPLFSENCPDGIDNVDNSEFAKAVREYRDSFNKAEGLAKRIFDSRMSEKERKAIRLAQQLLAVVNDKGASAGERQNAYEKIISTLKDFLPVHETARVELESRSGLKAIEA